MFTPFVFLVCLLLNLWEIFYGVRILLLDAGSVFIFVCVIAA